MTRKVVVYEGRTLPDGSMFEKGSLGPESDRIPIVWMNSLINLEPEHEGWATDFQRDEETGDISFEMHLDDSCKPLEDDFLYNLSASDWEYERFVGDKLVITRAVISRICLAPIPSLPKYIIND